MLTNGQKKALHVAFRAAGLGTGDAEYDAFWRRTVQQRIGGFYSAADRTASRAGFIAVMAFYERLMAARGECLAASPHYWMDEDGKANPTDSLVHLARRLAAELSMTEAALDEFLAGPHMSGGRAGGVDTAPAYWLRRLIEALKSMARRRAVARRR